MNTNMQIVNYIAPQKAQLQVLFLERHSLVEQLAAQELHRKTPSS